MKNLEVRKMNVVVIGGTTVLGCMFDKFFVKNSDGLHEYNESEMRECLQLTAKEISKIRKTFA